MKRVLVVDDEPDIREMVRTLLQIEPYEVMTAVEPNGAARVLADCRVDLVVTDFYGGLTPQAWRRSLAPLVSAAGETPILGMTSHELPREGIAAWLGLTRVIAKPFDLDDFLANVHSLMQRSRRDCDALGGSTRCIAGTVAVDEAAECR